MLIAGADCERERDHRDEQERRDDPPGSGTLLTGREEAAAPEHEHRDEREKRKPLRLCIPRKSPEDRALAVVQLAQDESEVQRSGEPAEIEHDECGNADRAARERA